MNAIAATSTKPLFRFAPALLVLISASVGSAAQVGETDLNARLLALEEAYAELERDTETRLAALRAEIVRLRRAAADDKNDAAGLSWAEAMLPKTEDAAPRLTLNGDARLRAEANAGQEDYPVRNRGSLRARLGAEYTLDERLSAGLRLVTGDPDDPRSSDVTLGDFVDDMTVSLDRAYVRYTGDSWHVVGGKFANPFVGTDLVWDGDFNPLGVAGSTTLPVFEDLELRATGIYSIVDEQTLGDDSVMWGGQLTARPPLGGDWQLTAAVGYYTYTIGSLANAGPGDIRDNFLMPDDSGYRSDFDLANATIELRYTGSGDRWPVALVADWVHNFGAATGEDRGYSAELVVGRRANAHDWRLRYGYALAETDAILAAFSHDNTSYGSNYRQHTLHVEHVLKPDVWLDLTAYFYRRNRAEFSTFGNEDYRSRLRFAVNVAY